jgi:Kdo2-lipid IVA lauroyltransferase/acyltransferase
MFLVKLFSKFPSWFVYGLAEVTAFFIYYILKYRRGVVRENLVNSFPKKDLKQIKQIEKRYYQNLLRVFLESFYSYGFDKDEWKKRINFENPDLLTNVLDKGTPIILLSGHLNNWEWAGSSISALIDYPFEFIYKKVKNEKFGELMLNLRRKHGGTSIPKDTAIRHILKRKNVPRIIGMVADQLPSIGTEKYWTKFLNQETPFYVGAERIATMVGYSVFYMESERVKNGKYNIRFKEIASPPYIKGQTGIIDSYVKNLESNIEKHPSQYLWSHKRWKYTKAEAEAAIKKAT